MYCKTLKDKVFCNDLYTFSIYLVQNFDCTLATRIGNFYKWWFTITQYCIVLYCIVLYRIVLYHNLLYCIVLYCMILYYIVWYWPVLYCIVLKCHMSLLHYPLNICRVFLIHCIEYSMTYTWLVYTCHVLMIRRI